MRLRAAPVQLDHGLEKLLGARPRSGSGNRSTSRIKESTRSIRLRNPRAEEGLAIRAPCYSCCMPNMGTCLVSSTLPSPRYMWTPQGRQGSKLRTARMMSIPLNLSGPFSSKIGVF